MPRLRSKVLVGTSLVLVGTVVHGLTRFLLNWTAGRTLGPADFGQLTLCIAIAQFAALLWPTTLGVASSKFVAAAPEGSADTLIRHLRRMAVGASLVAAGVAAGAWQVLGDGTWVGGVITAAVCLLYGLYHFTRGVLMGERRFARTTLLEIALAASCLIPAAIVAFNVGSGLAFAASLALGFAVFVIGGFRRTITGSAMSHVLRREVRTYVAIGTIGTIASSGFLQLSVVAAAHWGGPVGVGLYGAALAVATPASIFAVSLGAALMPSMSAEHAQGSSARLAAVTDRAMRGINLLAVPLFGSLVILGDQFTTVVWGEKFAGSVPVLRVLLIAVMLTSCAVPSVTRLSATSTQSLASATRISIGGVGLAGLAWIPLGTAWGERGVAWGYLIGAATTATALFGVNWRKDSQAWTLLAGRTFVATALLVGVAATDPALTPFAAVGYAAVFSALYVFSAWLPSKARHQTEKHALPPS